jgi:serine protease Do
MGIVSAKGRANMGIVDYEDFIQTDAAINPGNSGGALVDMEGRLVGINTAILSRTGGNMGIGFAIPSNMAKPIMDSLLKHGKVLRGWLGVSIQDIDRDLANAMNLPSTTGALIAEVMQGSPAAKAGLRAGDVVLEMDGSKVSNAGRLRNSIAAAGSKSTVKLKVLREGKERMVDVQLGELPGDEQAQAGRSSTAPGGGALDGLTVESLTPQNRRAHGIGESVRTGVVVVDIDRRSPAAASGLRPGDVIVEVNRRSIADVAAFKQAYSGSKRQTLLLVNRRGQSLFLVLKR